MFESRWPTRQIKTCRWWTYQQAVLGGQLGCLFSLTWCSQPPARSLHTVGRGKLGGNEEGKRPSHRLLWHSTTKSNGKTPKGQWQVIWGELLTRKEGRPMKKKTGSMPKRKEGPWLVLHQELPGTPPTTVPRVGSQVCPASWAHPPQQHTSSPTHCYGSDENAFGTRAWGCHCWVPQSRCSSLTYMQCRDFVPSATPVHAPTST